MSNRRKRLHPVSPLFLVGGTLKEFAVPLLAALFFGRHRDSGELIVGATVLTFGAWNLLRAWCFSYEFGESVLSVREGVLDRTQRHIPFARIQGISQRRHLLHRLLGVTEVHLESAGGGAPEATLKVLGLRAAAELESLLRDARSSVEASTAEPVVQLASPPLHALSPAEILRLGLISNRGMIVLGVVIGLVMPNQTLRTNLGRIVLVPMHWLSNTLQTQMASGHNALLIVGAVLSLLAAFVLLRLLSVVLAFFHYHGFTLTQDGERLQVQRGLLTIVRAGARLPRLQRWELEETWLHRWFRRCRLAVSVAGSAQKHEHGTSPDASFTELAPIATRAQAHALLRLCLPDLEWDALQWQKLHPATVKRRLIGQARWVLPALLACAWMNANASRPLPWSVFVVLASMLASAMLWHARAWARFGAIAEAGDVLLFRCGVWNRRWIVVATSRLQNLQLYSSPLDRSLGIVHFQADTRGGSHHHRALDIPCMDLKQAEALRATIWKRISTDI